MARVAIVRRVWRRRRSSVGAVREERGRRLRAGRRGGSEGDPGEGLQREVSDDAVLELDLREPFGVDGGELLLGLELVLDDIVRAGRARGPGSCRQLWFYQRRKEQTFRVERQSAVAAAARFQSRRESPSGERLRCRYRPLPALGGSCGSADRTRRRCGRRGCRGGWWRGGDLAVAGL